MKYLFAILMMTFLNHEILFAQNDSSYPLSVSARVIKAYQLKFPKERFAYQTSRGLYNITTDSVQQKQYDVEIILRNNSTQPISVWLMTCSWEDNFHINNNYMYLKGHDCDHNFPELVKLLPGSTKAFNTTLSKSIKFQNSCKNCIYGPQVESTKLGFIVVDDIFNPRFDGFFGYNLAMEDESVWKIVWSNPLYLLTEEEAHPRPVSIPVYQIGQ